MLRSKLLAELSSLCGPVVVLVPSRSPFMTIDTLESVPAPRRSLVFTTTLYCTFAPAAPAVSVTRLWLFFSQSPYGKYFRVWLFMCVSSQASRHQSTPSTLPIMPPALCLEAKPMSILLTSPSSLAPKFSTNSSVWLRSKLLALVSSGISPDAPDSPCRITEMSASVPAPRQSAVTTLSWYACFAAGPLDGSSVMVVVPFLASSHWSAMKKALALVFWLRTSTCCRCHAGPSPRLLCPICSLEKSPTSGPSTTNSSRWARSKLLALFSRASWPDCPLLPKSTHETLASVPAPRQSDV
mmetsp:Transcript_12394/g.31216  ORF Transcript_12394/g.31216 Transcript_12394/m.31216 type:complete len:297 (+) Transcript_12394:3136-4026(+)